MKKPMNYREIPIQLSDDASVFVAALAKPNYCGQDVNETFEYLKNNNISVVFGLESAPDFLNISSHMGLQYIDCSIPDFTAPNIEFYDEVYDEMIHQASLGKKIAIHCHGGMGRTGTVLTALKLREMACSDLFYDKSPAENLQLALSSLRRLPGNAHIVEVQEQEDSLCEYIEKLINNRRPSASKSK